MKKGFTMIELIFVIVILGILASVAIPRLAGTREDAEISATIANLRTLLSDASSYHVAKGNFDGAKWKDFTNVHLKKADGNAIDAAADAVGGQTYLAVGGKNCLQVGIMETTTSAFFAFMPIPDNDDPLCASVLASTPVKQLLDSGIVTGDAPLDMCTGVSNGGLSCLNITPNRIY
ncbi:type II secretion system protein [Campylobacter magnus]|uniref:Type II secretion system protein n=1 Tax=Campylobacter magnus TaxID=3026462 RepID=A0ABT8T7V6_9BACT|nr:type II secretion system protein [Campylobacter magnus]MDO2409623.1 type II secretion system protein [Campylobacter magnus]